MNERNFTGTLRPSFNTVELLIDIDGKQYLKIKNHLAAFVKTRQVCPYDIKCASFLHTPIDPESQYSIIIHLDPLDDPADFKSLKQVDVRYEIKVYRKKMKCARLKLLSISAI